MFISIIVNKIKNYKNKQNKQLTNNYNKWITLT